MKRLRLVLEDTSGATMIEFSIVFPLLLLLLFAIIEFSYFVAFNNSVETAAREGARYGSAVGIGPNGLEQYVDCAGIRDAARAKVTLVAIDDLDVTVFYDEGPGTALEAYNCNEGPFPPISDVDNGSRIIVEVTAMFQPLTGSLPVFDGVMQPTAVVAEERRSIYPGNL